MNPSNSPERNVAPISDAIVHAVARLVDDARSGTRAPSHYQIQQQISSANLTLADPKTFGETVGKAKRVRAVLSWALDNSPESGGVFVGKLISLVRGCGGFREDSPNFVGQDVIKDVSEVFKTEGYQLLPSGEVSSTLLDNLEGTELSEALEAYVRRAKRGAMDAALVTGTGKDLLEATAAHILHERWGAYSDRDNFPTLLGQAFVTLGMATPQQPEQLGEPPQNKVDRALYQAGVAVNHLRNKEGTGHGRLWMPSVTNSEGKVAVEIMGVIAERLLTKNKVTPK
jgi:hypothetical protein